MKHFPAIPRAALVALIFTIAGAAQADSSAVPEPFRGHDPSSEFTISYDDLNSLFAATVLHVGRSSRDTAAPTHAKTGTRVKNRVNNKTTNEGNRFYFEAFKENPEYEALLKNIRDSLAQVPDEVPLKHFSRKEQLAYWINLYNTTLLAEIVDRYPQRSLKKLITGKKSILSKKLLTVAGVPLSLNDIQYTILKENYDGSKLIVYGLYQGIIGGPNIRKRAYTGENVYRNLQSNAEEFINSNRGTFARDEKVFRVSSLYGRNEEFFGDPKTELKEHLMQFLEGHQRSSLQSAAAVRTDINDWTITDLYGSFRQVGGSLADNRAALMGAVQNTSITDDGGTITTTLSADAASMLAKTTALDRFPPEVVARLKAINTMREAAAQEGATVTIEDFENSGESGEAAEEEQPEED